MENLDKKIGQSSNQLPIPDQKNVGSVSNVPDQKQPDINIKKDKKENQVVKEFMENIHFHPDSFSEDSSGEEDKFKKAKSKLLDSRVISEEYDKEGRKETAKQIFQTREKASSISKNILDKEEMLKQISEEDTNLFQSITEKKIEIEERLDKVLIRIKRFIRLGDKLVSGLEQEINTSEIKSKDLLNQKYQIREELQVLKKEQAEIPNSRMILREYYKKIEILPLTNIEKRDLLLPEVLSRLSTQEYIAMWRRLNPYFLTHVTRQGFRDHTGTIYHTDGVKEFHNSFLKILEDNKLLRPSFAAEGLLNRDKKSIKKWFDNYLANWVFQERDERKAKEKLYVAIDNHIATAPYYPDKTAVHFAAQIISDSMYGGEKNNEIFVIYPSDVLASQYNFAFNGGEKDFSRPQSDQSWNDIFIWANTIENPGIPLDSGIVFLPQTTLVDSNTGSKYASEARKIHGKEKRVMLKDVNLADSFIEWIRTLNDQSLSVKIMKENKGEYRNIFPEQSIKRYLSPLSREIQKLGFRLDSSAVIARYLLEWTMSEQFKNIDLFLQSLSGMPDEELKKRLLENTGAIWERARDPIPAEKYWKDYFLKNPHLQPKHIIYYDAYEGTPSTAVYEFIQKNHIGEADTSKTDGPLLGFDDHHVSSMKRDSRANRGFKELIAIVDEIIDDYYKNK